MARYEKKLNIGFPEDLWDQVKDSAEYRAMSPSAIIRQACVEFLEAHPTPVRAADQNEAA